MNLREALILQSPSLELQRAAADEIARLDATIRHLATVHYETQAKLGNVRIALQSAVEYDRKLDADEKAPDGSDYNDLFGYVQSAINCTTKETA
jgi:hypothetical protein